MLNTINILDVSITNENKEKILEYFFDRLKTAKTKTFIITPNPEMLVYATKHLDYKDKLNSSTISLPDGVGLFFASAFMGKALKERITGVDFIKDLCLAAENNPLSMGFLGGKRGVAKRTAERLLRKYPYLNIVYASDEWNDKGFAWQINGKKSKKSMNTYNKRENQYKVSQDASIDILFVAYGIPKQEEWIYTNLSKLPAKAAMGVGGAFDYISGNIKRAPFILRFLGLEWLFRLLIQPWRWKRQLALLDFIKLIFKEKYKKI